MATRTAAKILGWGSVLGTIEPGKLGDLIVVHATSEDPYDRLIRAKETDVTLVVINGVSRYGGEPLTMDGQKRTLFLKQDTQDPVVGAIQLSQARATLKDALSKLPALAKALEEPQPVAVIGRKSALPTWQLASTRLRIQDLISARGFEAAEPASSPDQHAALRKQPSPCLRSFNHWNSTLSASWTIQIFFRRSLHSGTCRSSSKTVWPRFMVEKD